MEPARRPSINKTEQRLDCRLKDGRYKSDEKDEQERRLSVVDEAVVDGVQGEFEAV